MDSAEHVCSVCGQPVETVVRRHKTLGAWVPVWVAGPCHNPDCEASVDEGAEGSEGSKTSKASKKGGEHGKAAAEKS
ncbi:hypothetical protein [Streptomyces dysideae]|uniref:Uncharacterized protein n=1 Tax=Streptomyces dysideae TaxID=909626 RepID=A0A101UUM2_9ACTN|nr:hypothetical protein [Streptomyces dysideae]KUO17115.1 hypothetical protein AQJ91_32270 [Streptomyces dysideae]